MTQDKVESTQYVHDANEIVGYALNTEVNFKDAISGHEKDEWKEAILNEMKSLVKNKTWELVPRPKTKNIIGCRYVLTNKYDANGNLYKRKARLVAQGFTQQPQIDYTSTFAPVARLTSIRMLLALAVKYNMIVEQIDVTTAFLNGTLNEELYMKLPPLMNEILKEIVNTESRDSETWIISNQMLTKMDQDVVCLLKGSLYGLKQAGLQWNTEVNNVLTRLGLKRSNSDSCIYFAGNSDRLLLVSVYVDDFLITSQDLKWIKYIKDQLSTYFDVKDLGKARYCLGLEICQSPGIITIKQSSYIKQIIKKFNMVEANPVVTPLEVGMKLANEEVKENNPSELPYRELVGALMYAAVATRPDIFYAVSFLAQFNNSYNVRHWKMAKRVIRYLIGTKDIGLEYRKTDDSITGYVDADWGGCPLDRKSYTGYAFMLSGAAISWKSQKQKTVALSSTEAEYMGITEAVKEAVYWSNFMNELGLEELLHIIIYNDNQGAKLLSDNPVFHSRTKHIDIRHHFVRDTLKDGKIKLEYLNTDQMKADILTKAVTGPKHASFCHGLGSRKGKLFIEEAC